MKKSLLFAIKFLAFVFLSLVISKDMNAQITFSNSGQSLGYIGGGQGQYVAVTGDINGDGRPDAIAAAWPGPIDIHTNTGGGVMTSSQLPAPSGGGYWSGLALADIDNDGDIDLLAGAENGANGGLYIYKNNGAGVFTAFSQPALLGSNKSVNWVSAADVDGDGDIDLLVSNRWGIANGTKILLNDGIGNFSSGFVFPITNGAGNLLIDIDGDGDNDVMLNSSSTNIYKNNGNGTFTFSQSISGNKLPTKQSDLDGDGDIDFVIGENNRFFVHKNNGTGNFTLFQTVAATGVQGWAHIGIGDLDGDGDKDVYVPSIGGSDQDMVLANNGKAGFCKVTVPSINTGQADDVRLEDFNGDGKLDVYVTNLGTEGDVIWYNTTTSPYVSPVTIASSNSPVSVGGTINLAYTGTFSSRNWTGPNGFTSTLANPQITNAGVAASGTYTVNAFDGSGCIATATTTVIVSDHPAPIIVCPNNITVNNTPGQNGASVTFAATETTPGSAVATFTYSIQPGSLFPVGTTTVTATATNDIGSTSCSFTVTVIKVRSNSFIKNTAVQFGGLGLVGPRLGDVDGDGDLDLIAARYGNRYELMLFTNDGDGNYDAGAAIPGINDANYEFGDLDNDGDLDLIVPTNWASQTYGKIFLNDGHGNFTIMSGSFISGFYGYPLAKIIDINQDGKNDIVYTGIRMQDGTYHTEIWLNTGTTGNANFALNQTIIGETPTGNSIDVADIDGDGDLDMVSGGNSWPAQIYVNNQGAFAPPYNLTTNDNGYAGNVYLLDWDNDGDKDLVRYDGYNNSGLYVNRNDGQGNFSGTGTLLFNNVQTGFPLSQVSDFKLADVNNDGLPDAVLFHQSSAVGFIKVLLNKGCSFELQPYSLSEDYGSGLFVGDLDNDGFQDLGATNYYTPSYIYLNDLLQVTAVPLSNITSTTDATLCGNGAITLSAAASNNGTIKWWDAAAGGSLLAIGASYSPNVSATTTYYVDATNSNGCVSPRVPITATVGQAPVASITSSGSTVCGSSTVTLTASAASSYLWSNGASSQSITVNSTGNYSVKVTNASGCSATSSPFTVSSPSNTATFTTLAVDSDIQNVGQLVAANNLGASAAPVAINGVCFSNSAANLTNFANGGGAFCQDCIPGSNLKKLLDALVFQPNGSESTLTIGGLTSCHRYRLQLIFSNDVNSTGNNINVNVNGVTYSYSNWIPAAKILTVEFTASSASTVVRFLANNSAEPNRAVLNGYAMHDLDMQNSGPCNSDPVANAGSDINAGAAANCTANVTLNGSASSDPDGVNTISSYTWKEGQTVLGTGVSLSTNFSIGAHTITLEVKDSWGIASSDIVVVTVKDETPPSINCPTNIVVNNDPGTCGAIVNFNAPTVSDNCNASLPSISGYRVYGNYGGKTYYISNSPIPASDQYNQQAIAASYGAHLLTINDAAENAFAASVARTLGGTYLIVPYNDVASEGNFVWASGISSAFTSWDISYGQPQANNRSENYTVYWPAGTGSLTWHDISNVSGFYLMEMSTPSSVTVIQTSGISSGSTFPIGTTTNTFEATDLAGNKTTCSFQITVTDNQAPTITCPANQSVNATSASGAVVTYTAPVGTDNCPGSVTTLTGGFASGSNFPIGITTVTYTVTDAAGLTASCSFVVTVTGLPPAINCPQNITVNNDAGKCGANVDFAATETTGNPVSTISYSIAPGTYFAVGTTTVTATATNSIGSSSCNFTVTVNDNERPTIIAPAAISVNNDAGACAATITSGTPVTGDNCTVATVTNDHPSTTYPVGTTVVTWTVTDIHGNSSSATQTITVTDNEKPVITQPTAQTFCANANGSNVYTIPVASATDNCTIATITYSVTGATTRTGSGYNASGAFAIGTSNITWTITDVNGNITQRSTTVVINPLPVATYVSSNADAFCNGVTLTGSSSINAATYSWSNTNAAASFSNSSLLNLGLSNADGNYYLYVKATATGCVSATSAVYNYQKQTLSSSYTILAYKEVELGKYNKVVTGSVGVMTSKGEAEFKSYTSVNGVGAFVKAPRIDKDGSGILIPNQIIGIATVTLPAMQLNTSSTNNLPSFTASVNNATLSGNYKNLTIKKGISVTLTNNTFGSIRLEEGASVRFTNSILNIESLTADKGARNNDYSYVRFAPNTSVRVSSKVSFGSQVLVNPEANKVTFYMGDNRKDEEKFTVKGGDTRVIANVFMPDGKLRVTATDSDDDDRGNCDHRAHDYRSCRHRGHEHNDCDHRGHQASSCNDDVYMTGLFIAEEVESKGNTVIWNSFNCSAPAPVQPIVNKTGTTQTVTEEKTEVKASTEEELKVTVMPNPSTTYFTLKLESKYETPVNLRVMDGSGRVVDAKSKIGSNSTFQIGHNYSSGTYYAELIQGTKRKVVQLMKVK